MNLETLLDVCRKDISVSYWTQVTHSLFWWLERSPLTHLAIGGALVLGFLIASGLLMRGFIYLGRGRSIKRLWLWGFPIALLLSISPLLIGEPLLTQFLPTYEGQTADAVVVLGRGRYLRPSRVLKAAELIAMDRAPQVFVSGRGDAVTMVTMLTELGIDSSKIAGEDCSATTEQNALYTAQQLLPAGVESIILVSDPPHLLRSQLVFRSLGFKVIPYPSPLPENVSLRHRRLLAMRESLGLVAYGLMGRYLPRPIADVNTTAVQ
ncbi:MAG: YdcF family protein [Cyanobacteria bacterium P01_H01_bin.21]